MTIALDTAVRKPPSRRAAFWGKLLRRPLRCHRAALVGLFILLALAGRLGALGSDQDVVDHSPQAAGRCIGSEPTNSDATCWRGCSPARGPRCMAGVVSVTIAVAIGGPLGLAAGYFGGWTTP